MPSSTRLSIHNGQNETLVDLSGEGTWGDVLDALGPAAPSAAMADGVPLRPDTVIGFPPLVDGSIVEPLADKATAKGTFKLLVTEGPGQGSQLPLRAPSLVLGRDHPLLDDDPLASRRHAIVTIRHGEVRVQDLGSANGVVLAGRTLSADKPTLWKVGERLRIGATELVLGLADAARPTPTAPSLQPRTFEWPTSTPSPRLSGMRWVAVIAPVPVALCMAWLMKSWIPLAFAVMSPVMVLAASWEDRRNGHRTARQSARDVAADKRRMAAEMADALHGERDYRRVTLPGPERPLVRRRSSGPRTPSDPLVTLRLGQGRSRSVHTVARAGQTSPLILADAPVPLPLMPRSHTRIAVPERHTRAVTEWVCAQLLAYCPPSASLDVAVPAEDLDRWAWSAGVDGITVSSTPPKVAAPTPVVHDGPPRFVVVDTRVGPSSGEGRERVETNTVWIDVGPGQAASSADVWHLRPGHLASRSPDGEPFTMDAPVTHPLTSVLRMRYLERSADATGLPVSVAARDLQPLHVRQAWERPSTDVPVGRDATGTYTLDLVSSGPHALVAGTTGSGKSEFLLAYLRGLFAQNPPTHVTALLIDYKGGATFSALTAAPHVVGTVTDLDVGLAERALVALTAEIKRREAALSEIGATSFQDSMRLAGPGSVPHFPRLFIVVDEFKVLADELPDFVRGLVRLAAVGRSLGVHVILATQRPGGAVTPDIRANLDTRVALRVRERHESVDIIDGPEAATISRSRPGRAFVAIGGEKPHEVQMAHTLASSRNAALHVHPVLSSGVDWACPGCSHALDADAAPGSELTAFLPDLREAARGLPSPHRPLLPPLPEYIESVGLPTSDGAPRMASATCICVSALTAPAATIDVGTEMDGPRIAPVAVADLPEKQAQPFVLPDGGLAGVAGAPRSGRTTAALAFARSAAHAGHTVWWLAAA